MKYIKTYENRGWWNPIDNENHPILGAKVGDIVVNIVKIGNGDLTPGKSYRISQIFDKSIYCDTIQTEVKTTNDMMEVENLDGSPVLSPIQYLSGTKYEPTRTRAAWFVPELDWNMKQYNL